MMESTTRRSSASRRLRAANGEEEAEEEAESGSSIEEEEDVDGGRRARSPARLREVRRRTRSWRRTTAGGARTARALSAQGVGDARKKMKRNCRALKKRRGSWACNR
jgi:hypothetical protein